MKLYRGPEVNDASSDKLNDIRIIRSCHSYASKISRNIFGLKEKGGITVQPDDLQTDQQRVPLPSKVFG